MVVGCTLAILAMPPRAADAAAPTAQLSFDPAVPLVGETVTFNAVASPGTGATVSSYRWDLDGDGSFELNTGLTATAATSYASERTLTVSVQVRDSFDDRVTATRVLTVGGRVPLASFGFAPAQPLVDQPVTFTSFASDPGGAIVEEAWDLNGDGSFDNGSGPVARRSFSAPGRYVVGLRVTDNERHSAYASQIVTVTAPLRLLNPFPVVRISGALTKRGVRLRLVSVNGPVGSAVRVRCEGRDCPFRRMTRIITAPNGRIRVGELERQLPSGVRIRVYVTSPGTIGKYTTFKIRRGKGPRRDDACALHGSSRPVPCPAG